MASGEWTADVVCGEMLLSGEASRELDRLEVTDAVARLPLLLFGSTYRILRRIEGQNANLLLPVSFTLLLQIQSQQ